MKNILKTLIILFLITSCNMKSQQNRASKAKNTPEVSALIEKFNKQEHRLEINDCEVVYNGKSFFLGNTLDEVEAILGSKHNSNYGYAYAWHKIGLQVLKKKESSEIDGVNIYIYIYEGFDDIKPNINIVLVNGVPLTKEMNFGKFIENSTYEFDDFSIHRSFNLNIEECDSQKTVIEFDSNPIFNYSGGGHLQIRGDFNPKETSPVKKISIYKS